MDTAVATLRPDVDIHEAIAFLLERHVTGAPVVDGDNQVIGLLSEKDCMRLLAMGDGSEFPTGAVSEFMSHPVTCVTPEMNIYFVAGMFLREEARRFPVVVDGRLVGAITRFDILRAIRSNLGTAAR